MKEITFFGSGVEQEDTTIPVPEVASVITALSKNYDKLRFGGTNVGLMGLFAKEARTQGFSVTGVVPGWLSERYQELILDSDETLYVEDLDERKKMLFDTDAVICYPGGIGTMDELMALLAQIALEEIEPIPIYLYNDEGFFAPLLLQIEFGIKTGLIKKDIIDIIHVFERVDQLVSYLYDGQDE